MKTGIPVEKYNTFYKNYLLVFKVVFKRIILSLLFSKILLVNLEIYQKRQKYFFKKMIKKIYRLKEREIKKVLKYKKPFFAYNLVANYIKNTLPYSRFALILSGKNCKTAVSRNFFRRKFYDMSADSINKGNYDIVVVAKKGKTFDKKDNLAILDFEKDINFLYKNIFKGK